MNGLLKPLLLSLKPQYSDQIFMGLKKAELRRRSPIGMAGRDAFIYVTSPVMQLKGGFHIGEILSGTPEEIWSEVSQYVGVGKPEFDSYYAGQSIAYAFKITKVWQYKRPLGLTELRNRFANFVVPQHTPLHHIPLSTWTCKKALSSTHGGGVARRSATRTPVHTAYTHPASRRKIGISFRTPSISKASRVK